MSQIRKVANSYQQKKKEELVKLGNSRKSYKEILKYLDNEITKSKEMTNFNYSIFCFREDGVYQLHKAIEEINGVSISKAQTGPSNEKKNVEMIDIPLADGTRIKVPYGEIDLPDLGDGAQIVISYNTSSNQLYVKGCCQYMYMEMMDNIISRTEELLNTDSIYKNLAIEIGDDFSPSFISLDGIENQTMVLSDEAEYSLQPLKARLFQTELCKERGIPLKFGALLEGVYGTGKTLLAFKLGAEAIKNNWTFIYLKDPKKLANTIRLCKSLDKNGNGILLFLEDVDQVTRGNRDSNLQDILNTLDGGDTKDMNLISVFTTNHIELIEPTFLRGKRIGTVITLGYLDAKTAENFIKESFDSETYELEEDLTEITEHIANSNIVPAFMAEICETVKSNLIFKGSNKVTNNDIKLATNTYLRQISLSQKKDMSETDEMKLANAFKSTVYSAIKADLVDIKEEILNISE